MTENEIALKKLKEYSNCGPLHDKRGKPIGFSDWLKEQDKPKKFLFDDWVEFMKYCGFGLATAKAHYATFIGIFGPRLNGTKGLKMFREGFDPHMVGCAGQYYDDIMELVDSIIERLEK